jgi:hypothetical protein
VLKILADDPTLQFAQPAVQVGERAGSASIVVRRFGPTTAAVSVDYGTADGTAQAGTDYTASSGRLDFAPGVLARSFTVPVLVDTAVEPAETVDLSLFNASGAAVVGNPGEATLTITTDNPAIQFAAATYTVAESAAAAVITVRRLAPATAAVFVDYETTEGTATPGSDYVATSGRLTFPSGVTQRSFQVPLVNDTVFEGAETVGLRLVAAGGGARLGTPTLAVLTIAGNDAAGAIELAASDFSAAEGAAFATVTVTRSAGLASGVTVDLVAGGGTAVAGTDYVAGTTTVSFAAGETRKTVTIELVDDEDGDGNRTVGLTLANPAGGATLGARATATLWLVDDES